MDGWWDVERLDQLFVRLARLDRRAVPLPWQTKLRILADLFINRQRKSRAHRVALHHYDLGNDLYEAMLDERMVYTCGYWKDARTLADAQEAKLDLICRKLRLQPGQIILDIGCGWGSFVKFAVENYGVKAVGVNNSAEQTAWGRQMCKGLPIEIRFEDYRDIEGKFDHIVSIGMFEAVGPKNFRTFFDRVHRCLKDDGLFLLHTIGSDRNGLTDPWIEKYIFPGGVIPSLRRVGAALEGLFVMEDWHTFGADYDRTLMAWYTNFRNSWHRLKDRYDERFYRMWKYYLLSCAGAFRARRNNLWQIVLSKNGVPGGYEAVR